MGNWVRKRDPGKGAYIENQETGYIVHYIYPNQRFESGQQYIVQKDDFAMGFETPSEGLAFRHVDDLNFNTPMVFIGRIGGTFYTASSTGRKGFLELAKATSFNSKQQQDEFISVLQDAVPRIPSLPEYANRWDGGFGYQVEFTKEISEILSRGEFVQNA